MKLLNILMNECRPQFKCGAAAGLAPAIIGGSALSGALGLAGVAMQDDAASSNVAAQIKAQQSENQKNRDWQTQQAEIARQFEAGQVLQQNQFQKDLQAQQQQYNLQSMQKQAQLNSPVYMRQRLEQANINPQVYFGNHASFGGSSAVAGGSPSAPAGAKSPMPGSVAGLSPVSYQPSFLNLANIGANIAGTIKTLAEAKKLGVETGWIDEQTRSEVQLAISQMDYYKILTVGQKIVNQLENAKLPYAFEMAAKDLALKISQIEYNEENKITLKSQQVLNAALAKLHDEQSKLTASQNRKLGIEMPLYYQALESLIRKNYAEASESSAMAQSENEFRATRGSILGLEYAIKHNEFEISDETKKARVLDVLQKAVEQKWKTQDSYVNYLRDKYKLDTQGIKDIMNILYGWIPFTSKIE